MQWWYNNILYTAKKVVAIKIFLLQIYNYAGSNDDNNDDNINIGSW